MLTGEHVKPMRNWEICWVLNGPLIAGNTAAQLCRKGRLLLVKIILSLALSVSLLIVPCLAQFDGYKAEYRGGSLITKGNDGKLFIFADNIRLNMKDGETLDINPKNVTALSYGTEAGRRVKLWMPLAVVHPVALVGLIAKKRDHYVGIEYKDQQGRPGAILIKAHKSQYMAMLLSLHTVTGQKVMGVNETTRKKDDWAVMKEDKK